MKNEVVVEIKAVELFNEVFESQFLTYLKATEKKAGLSIKFNVLD